MKGHALSPAALDAAADEVRQLTGLIFQPSRRTDFSVALTHAMRRANERNPARYFSRVRSEPPLLDELIAEITIGETYFFRDPAQLAVVQQLAFNSFAPDRRLRVWSAGCASGEEPYTLAMMLRACGRASSEVIGTDLSRESLARARKAEYTRWSLRGVPEEAIRTHFEPVDRRVTPVRAVRDAVDFRYLNLAEDSYPSPAAGVWHMDVILCRNVLIYLDQETVKRVAERLIASLSSDGWLFVGSADPMLGNLVPCTVLTTDAGLAYRRPAAPPAAVWTRVPLDEPAFPSPVEEYPWSPPLADPGPGVPAAAVDDPTAVLAEVRALANAGELDGADRLCTAAMERHRSSAELSYLHAILLIEGGHFASAVTAARQALYLDRSMAVTHLALATALSRQGDQHGARLALRNAERVLLAMAPDAEVPASDGVVAGRLAAMTRMQLRLLDPGAA